MPKSSSLLIEVGQGLSLMIGLPSINTWDNQGRPTKVKQGTFGFNTETNNLEYWNGEHWLAASMTSLES